MDEELFAKHINPIQKVEINGDEFKLKPLQWKDMPKFWKFTNKITKAFNFGEIKEGEELTPEQQAHFSESLDEDTIDILLELELNTMKISYPETSEEVLKSFVKDNIFELMPHIILVNTPKTKGKNVDTKKNSKSGKS